MNTGSRFDDGGIHAHVSRGGRLSGGAGGGRHSGTIVIVSSFRPFQGGVTNPSRRVARQYAESVSRRPGFSTVEVTLDVRWDVDQRTIRDEIESVRNRWPHHAVEWVAFGQGHGTTMETLARNRREPVPDNDGRVPGGGPGHPGWENDPRGPELVLSDAADVQRILGGLAGFGVNVSQSVAAGGYLCESVLYELLLQQRRGNIRCGRFFHVPTTEHMSGGDPEKMRIERERHRFAGALGDITTRPQCCPACGSPRVAEVFYGMPPDGVAMQPLFDAGVFRLADKPLLEASPEWHCCACHHEWGAAHPAPLLRSPPPGNAGSGAAAEE